MDTFSKLFGSLLAFVYHCFDRIVIQGYLPLLTREEHIVHFFRDVHGIYPITKEALRARTTAYQQWVEAFARNHRIPMEWPDTQALNAKGLKKEDYVRPYYARLDAGGPILSERIAANQWVPIAAGPVAWGDLCSAKIPAVRSSAGRTRPTVLVRLLGLSLTSQKRNVVTSAIQTDATSAESPHPRPLHGQRLVTGTRELAGGTRPEHVAIFCCVSLFPTARRSPSP
jgi:hypothetical protein